ncbi:MAG: hypothetical protein L6Q98_04185 [Anaerolineae bacterium]|nr:hypothetical protein [Anaerolineae bacterium]NUQ03821.1 hypothetical protein [Anaerolineae bacterium]
MNAFGIGIAAVLGFWATITVLGVSVGLWLIFRKEYRMSFRSLVMVSAGALLLGSPLGLIPFGLAVAVAGQQNNEALITSYPVLWAVIVIWLLALLGTAYGIDAILRRRQRSTPGLPDGVEVARLFMTPDDAKQLEEMTRRKIILPM